jgi:N-acyl-D-aspartate/D-glutamate deacylase
MGLSEAVYRSSLLPAETFSLKKRGCIREGMYADIVIFDLNSIMDMATFDDPFQRSSGIQHVLVTEFLLSKG